MRHFTVEEASDALARVRPLTEQLVEAYRRLGGLQGEIASRRSELAGNGSTASRERLRELEREAEAEAEVVRDRIGTLTELGVQLKDPAIGLIDFPARRGSETVLLCWRLGEGEIGYWHGLEEGYAGRKPLPL